MNRLDAVRLLGLGAPVRPEGEGYGQAVPEDFELLVRALPQGVIAGSVLLGGADVPVRSLEDFTRDTALRLADMREALGSREQELWLPLHPRPRGMVPWGRTAAVEEIVTRVRSIGVPGVRQYAEELLGRAGESFGALPEDYLAVMREFPGGVVAGVRVFPVSARPGAPEPRGCAGWTRTGCSCSGERSGAGRSAGSPPRTTPRSGASPTGSRTARPSPAWRTRPSPRSCDAGCGATPRCSDPSGGPVAQRYSQR